MAHHLSSSFAVRLRDLLATLESSALLGAAETRMRGLGEQLQFACLCVPCHEALVALELTSMGRLQVPGVASADEWRPAQLEFPPSGTPFAFLLGGGSGYSAELEPDDSMLELLQPILQSSPRHAIFVPIRVGAAAIGGAALFSEEHFSDAQLLAAERLAEVLALTMESFRTERVLLQLFATMLPELCAADATTSFVAGLEQHIHGLRLTPEYRRRLELAETIGRIAAAGPAETRLATAILDSVEGYLKQLGAAADPDDEDSEILPAVDDELYG